ncbi:MAG: hypothetical protein ACI92B_001214, partial [Marinobacter maritimus]
MSTNPGRNTPTGNPGPALRAELSGFFHKQIAFTSNRLDPA